MLMHPDIGVLASGRCYVYLEGLGRGREPMMGSYEECLSAIEARGGVAEPIPTDGRFSLVDYRASFEASKPKLLPTNSAEPTGRRAPAPSQDREYVLSFETLDEGWRHVDGFRDGTERVFARDRNEALRKGRDILRETVGRHGPRIAIRARLAD